MSSFVYQGCLAAIAKGRLNFSRDKFRVMLVTKDYKPSKSHGYRSEISGEAKGFGYSPGGLDAQTRVDGSKIQLSGFEISPSSIKANAAVYYKDSGAPMLDTLVAYIDFEDEVSSLNGPFTLTDSTLRLT